MLELDRELAKERKIKLKTIEASMDFLPMLEDACFDIIIHPVSTCYVPDIAKVYAEVARLLVNDGIYISQHKQPASLQATIKDSGNGYRLRHPYYRREPLPPEPEANLIREQGTLEYVHRWEEILGCMCRSGMMIEDVTEPLHAKADAVEGSFAHRCQFVAPYVRIKARRKKRANQTDPAASGIILGS
jgi:SAM-dependent methyltransferase